jgi:hypothetical protein
MELTLSQRLRHYKKQTVGSGTSGPTTVDQQANVPGGFLCVTGTVEVVKSQTGPGVDARWLSVATAFQ